MDKLLTEHAKPIHDFQSWLAESEKVDPQAPATAAAPATPPPPATTPVPDTEEEGPEPVADTTPNQEEVEPDAPEEPGAGEVTDAGSEIEQFQQLDTVRKDAIRAFKAKQEEFMNIPVETRKNPQTDEDKQKVEGLKSELITLNTAMKDAIKAWEQFNNEMLGVTDEDETDEP